MIKMILSTDISNHFERISAFKARIQTKKFPEDTPEDKQTILNMCIYVSDHCNPCKSSVMYFKWMALEMEEYYQQGDIEKKLGYTVTEYFDRSTCNPFIFQKGYIEVVVEPLLLVWTNFLANMKEDAQKPNSNFPTIEQTVIKKGLEKNKDLINQKILDTKTHFYNTQNDNHGSDEMDEAF